MLNGTTALTPSDVVQLLMQMSGQDDGSIHALVDIGEPIHRDHYVAVAAAVRYAEEVRRAARDRGR